MTDLVGKVFGRLTIESYSHNCKKYRYKYWNCVCSCGNKIVVPTASLRRKKRPTESCGCLRLERIREKKPWNQKGKGDANSWSLFLTYKRTAKKRKIKFDLDYLDFKNITKSKCAYCGIAPEQVHKKAGTNGEYVYNGIDRLDSNVGYIKDNVVPCCKTCNYAKRIMSVKEFKEWIIKVYKNLRNKNEI